MTIGSNIQPGASVDYTVGTSLPGTLGRTGVISTPHGDIHTPAFVPVGYQGDGQDGAAGVGGRARCAGRAGQCLPPVPAAGASEIIDAAGGPGNS